MTDLATMLYLRYKAPIVMLDVIIKDYLPHLNPTSAHRQATAGKLPFPAFKMSGNKSDYFVNVLDVAAWLEKEYQDAKKDWDKMQG